MLKNKCTNKNENGVNWETKKKEANVIQSFFFFETWAHASNAHNVHISVENKTFPNSSEKMFLANKNCFTILSKILQSKSKGSELENYFKTQRKSTK